MLVINNGSTDGTLAMLSELGVRVITQGNKGSAGGWHRAIQYALTEGFDAVWLMDDDGYPDDSALARLEMASGPHVSCVSSIVVQEQRTSHFVFPFPILNEVGLPVIFGMPRKLETVQQLRDRSIQDTYPFVHLFNGALISLTAVLQAGNVDQDFFIYGEEVDFFYRLRKVGAVFSVLSARHYHPDVSTRPYNSMKVYYYIKNSLILNRRYYDWVFLRHVLMLGLILYRLLNRNGFLFVFNLVFGFNSSVFFRALSRGLSGNLGEDFVV